MCMQLLGDFNSETDLGRSRKPFSPLALVLPTFEGNNGTPGLFFLMYDFALCRLDFFGELVSFYPMLHCPLGILAYNRYLLDFVQSMIKL